jgi:hypothetical protein
MALNNYFEVLPPKKDKLSSYLYTDLKNQCSWRDNRSDAIQDQYKYFDSYYGKKLRNNYVNKDIICDLLNESEKAHNLQMNYQNVSKSKFIEMGSTVDDSFSLYSYDNDDKHFNIIKCDLSSDKNEINFDDLQNYVLDFDTNVRQISASVSESSVNFMDMYSIYKTNFEEKSLSKFEKVLTLAEVPNNFMSSSLLDNMFIISCSVSTTENNKITLIDAEYNIQSLKEFDNENISRPFKKGEFLNHPKLIIAHKDSDEAVLIDFRVLLYL